MNFSEFQVKKGAVITFDVKGSANEKETRTFKDGERFICFVSEENKADGKVIYSVEDVDSKITGLITSDSFYKITEFKIHSKKFHLLKQQLKIVDK